MWAYGTALAQDDEPDGIAVPVAWLGPEDVPILHANAFVSQFDPQTLDTLLLTVGQMTPPAIAGATDQERQEQARAISYVAIKPIVRLALSPARARELIATLEANLDQLALATRVNSRDPRA
jgi:hypothetical protein